MSQFVGLNGFGRLDSARREHGRPPPVGLCGAGGMVFTALLVVAFSSSRAPADIAIETVHVANPGNSPDTRHELPGYGAVGYAYDMGKYELTMGQYAAFLNAVAGVDTYGLYSFSMNGGGDSWGGGIFRHGSTTRTYSVTPGYENRPVSYVSFGDALRFANWMHNGQPTGAQGPTTTEDGSYFLNGATSLAALLAVTRKPGATWAIPSENEWYKTAYHKNDGATDNYWEYPTSSDSMTSDMANTESTFLHPLIVGSYAYPSAYGTFDQAGNVNEWNESVIEGLYRGVRGGAFNNDDYTSAAGNRYSLDPTLERSNLGFRIAMVPEPGSLIMAAVAALAVPKRRKKRHGISRR
ncbi:MAG TPA: SUMF1/EgtB/PvdO family nonheme iron enzyme [Phycisphaerae bacterium]|nr:SUMF1/EgtB/PvdO family nonheme iron enzyme [Phycisphaerae bacterium]